MSDEIDKLAKKLAKDPQSKVFIQLAEEYGKAGLFQDAAAVLEEGLKTYPTFLTARVALGRVYYQLGLVPKAKAILEEAIKMSPENLLAHRTLAQLYVREGAPESALRSCSVVLSVNPQDEEILALKATIAQRPAQTLPPQGVQETTATASQRAHSQPELPGGKDGEASSSDQVKRLTAMLGKIRQQRIS